MTKSGAYIQIRCSEEFKAEMEAAAVKVGLSVSRFTREAVEEKIASVEGEQRSGDASPVVARARSAAPSLEGEKRSYRPDFKGPKAEPKKKW